MSNGMLVLLLFFMATALAAGLIFIGKRVTFFQQKTASTLASDKNYSQELGMLYMSRRLLVAFSVVLIGSSLLALVAEYQTHQQEIIAARQEVWPVFDKQKVWVAPDPYLAQTDDDASLIEYGQDLIAHTQDYFGTYGIVRPSTINGLNCQNCHLEAGSKPFGNNYFGVQSTYPQMRARSGALETIPKRINDCIQRSLNGVPIDSTSREMRAIMAYMRWLGTAVPKGEKPKGVGLVEVPFLDRPADPARGKIIYSKQCASCHADDGQGLPIPNSARDYPPLWGARSYNEGAGLFRLSRFAGYIKANMPFGTSYLNPVLSDEEAWDLAAFVNSQPRPKHPFLATDWPKIEKKPFDHPFGPFKDSFPEMQHKYGPFGPIVAFYKK